MIEATGTIPLQSGLPTVTGTPLVIQGPGASDLSLDASALTAQRDTVLVVDPVNQCAPSAGARSPCEASRSITHTSPRSGTTASLTSSDSRVSDTTYYGVVNGRRLRVIDSTLSDNRYGISALMTPTARRSSAAPCAATASRISTSEHPLNVTESSLIGSRRYGIDNAFGGVVIEGSTLAGSRITAPGGPWTSRRARSAPTAITR